MSQAKLDRLLLALAVRGCGLQQGNGPMTGKAVFRIVAGDACSSSGGGGTEVSAAIAHKAISEGYLVANAAQRFVLSPTGRARARKARVAAAQAAPIDAPAVGQVRRPGSACHRTASAKPQRPRESRSTPQQHQTANPQPGELLAADTPLAWLRLRKDREGNPLISDLEFAAGARLRADYLRALQVPSVTTCWRQDNARTDHATTSQNAFADHLDRTIAAKARLNAALAALDPEIAGVVVDVCCHGLGLTDIEANRKWPPRSAKIPLGIGLRGLAAHYGLSNDTARVRVAISHGRIVFEPVQRERT